MNIRNYQKGDYQSVKEILLPEGMFEGNWESEENINEIIAKDPESIMVAVEDQKVIGNIMFVQHGRTVAFLFRLAVAKAYRRKGVAKKLLEYVESLAKKRGVKEIVLFASAENEELQSFYSNRGFSKSSSRFYCHWKEIS